MRARQIMNFNLVASVSSGESQLQYRILWEIMETTAPSPDSIHQRRGRSSKRRRCSLLGGLWGHTAVPCPSKTYEISRSSVEVSELCFSHSSYQKTNLESIVVSISEQKAVTATGTQKSKI